jgi:hypothetical protein
MPKGKVVKMDGSLEDFDQAKIERSCVNAGAPPEVAREIAEEVSRRAYDGISTREIRAMVLEELEKRNPEWADNWRFYDRIVKNRITFEKGKFVVVEKGSLYLGREVRDVGERGLSDVEEVKAIVRELKEDLERGIPRRTIHNRTYVLFMAVLKSKKLDKHEKLRSIDAINEFRKGLGWKPFELKKPL